MLSSGTLDLLCLAKVMSVTFHPPQADYLPLPSANSRFDTPPYLLMPHTSLAAIVCGSKKHTDYADVTDRSFHGCFLTRLFDRMLILTDSDASVIGSLKSKPRNELAQNPLNLHIIN